MSSFCLQVKIPYGESRLAVIDCLEGICMYNDELRVWRADIKKGHFYRLDYNGWGQRKLLSTFKE